MEILISVVVLLVCLCSFLVYYAIAAARKLYVISTNLETVYLLINSFRSHVEQVHEAEMFYGDQTLQALIEHSTAVLDELDSYEDMMSIVLEEESDATQEEE
mgnify:CR=1 FL=1